VSWKRELPDTFGRTDYRYLPSYPYILSAPLHTYAGLLAFYLAQPISRRSQKHRESSMAGSDDSDEGDFRALL